MISTYLLREFFVRTQIHIMKNNFYAEVFFAYQLQLRKALGQEPFCPKKSKATLTGLSYKEGYR